MDRFNKRVQFINRTKNWNVKEKQDFQGLQRELWQEQRKNGNPWLISDFITLGSPLAHAQFLMAKSFIDLDRRQQERELPVCPPILDEKKISYNPKSPYEVEDPSGKVQKRNIHLLHHAAPFGPTRWTNLYFPGDFIGGNLSELFGVGVYDIKVLAEKKWKSRTILSHTGYWYKMEKKDYHKEGYNAISALRNALGLNSRPWL